MAENVKTSYDKGRDLQSMRWNQGFECTGQNKQPIKEFYEQNYYLNSDLETRVFINGEYHSRRERDPKETCYDECWMFFKNHDSWRYKS
jgi:hypothetical protein